MSASNFSIIILLISIKHFYNMCSVYNYITLKCLFVKKMLSTAPWVSCFLLRIINVIYNCLICLFLQHKKIFPTESSAGKTYYSKLSCVNKQVTHCCIHIITAYILHIEESVKNVENSYPDGLEQCVVVDT